MAEILGFITHYGSQNCWAFSMRRPLSLRVGRGWRPRGTSLHWSGSPEAQWEAFSQGPRLCPPKAVVPIPGIHLAPLETGNRQRKGMGGSSRFPDLPHAASLRPGTGAGLWESSIPRTLGHSRVSAQALCPPLLPRRRHSHSPLGTPLPSEITTAPST